jgi:hypothetical protein
MKHWSYRLYARWFRLNWFVFTEHLCVFCLHLYLLHWFESLIFLFRVNNEGPMDLSLYKCDFIQVCLRKFKCNFYFGFNLNFFNCSWSLVSDLLIAKFLLQLDFFLYCVIETILNEKSKDPAEKRRSPVVEASLTHTDLRRENHNPSIWCLDLFWFHGIWNNGYISQYLHRFLGYLFGNILGSIVCYQNNNLLFLLHDFQLFPIFLVVF